MKYEFPLRFHEVWSKEILYVEDASELCALDETYICVNANKFRELERKAYSSSNTYFMNIKIIAFENENTQVLCDVEKVDTVNCPEGTLMFKFIKEHDEIPQGLFETLRSESRAVRVDGYTVMKSGITPLR
ncbi:hypothetical protein ABDZ57_02175 [Aeromonas veronii]|uniref:hypothetical protein n=1 Tax=Aeromonas veronii TaxID=654 RepID=UPI0031FCEFA9